MISSAVANNVKTNVLYSFLPVVHIYYIWNNDGTEVVFVPCIFHKMNDSVMVVIWVVSSSPY